MRRLPNPWLVLGLAACAGAPAPAGGGDVPPGIETTVEVLDAGFVRFEGRRQAREMFLLEMRERVRAASGDPAAIPRLDVRIPDDAGVDGGWLSAFRDELHKAGLRWVRVGAG